MDRIAVASHKGGTGKTTVTVNLAGALAEAGRRVLVVDVDPQGAAAAALGVPATPPTLYDVLAGKAGAREAIRPSPTVGIDVLPAGADLAGADVELPRTAGWQRAVAVALARLRSWDVVLIDTAPGLGVLPYAALVAATRALVVVEADFLSLRSLPDVLTSAERAGVPLAGIVPNAVGRRTRHQADVLAELHRSHRAALLPAIPSRVALRDAAVAGVPVATYAPHSDAAEAFRSLSRRLCP
jgi:chromosome partitioning protein